MWELQLEHCLQRQYQCRDELCRISQIERIDQVDSSKPEMHPFQFLHYPLEGVVADEEFDLAGTVKEEIGVLVALLDSVLEPGEVGFKLFHAVDEAPVGSKSLAFHHLFKGQKVAHIHLALVSIQILGRKETSRGKYGSASLAKSRFTITGFLNNKLRVKNGAVYRFMAVRN